MNRRRGIGAEVHAEGTHFRVWAPAHDRVAVVIEGEDHPLTQEERGYFCGLVSGARAGTRYRLRPGGDEQSYPDPASRFQPEGPHGPSEVVDPSTYSWRDDGWRGVAAKGRVIYETHIGTFTQEGTYAAAMEHLAYLSELGVNVVELMPLSDFPGRFGWGYDGVDVWAPTRLYGKPDDLRRFVDEAHLHGIGVILDVVYNHLGPDGCYLAKFTRDYFTDRYMNEWGDPLNFDGENAHGVREFFAENAAMWADEYHFDGLRIDATQSMFDSSDTHIVREISDRMRAAARGRSIYLVAENEPQERRLLDRDGIDAMWNDDWHHSARVATTGRAEGYYMDYHGSPQELVSMARLGFLYQGQYYAWQKKPRGTPSHDIPPEHFVCYLQNHDQVANSAGGARLHDLTSPGRFRAITALMLLQPQTPFLFQGQEFGASSPFVFFADHKEELARAVAKGRKEFLMQFPSVATEAAQRMIAPPHELATFEMCKLDHAERDANAGMLALHRELLRLRRREPFASQRSDWMEGAILSSECLALRWFTGGEDDTLLIVNLGRELRLDPVPEPLLAPPQRSKPWMILWSSEQPEYGGTAMAEPQGEAGWDIAPESAVVLRAR